MNIDINTHYWTCSPSIEAESYGEDIREPYEVKIIEINYDRFKVSPVFSNDIDINTVALVSENELFESENEAAKYYVRELDYQFEDLHVKLRDAKLNYNL